MTQGIQEKIGIFIDAFLAFLLLGAGPGRDTPIPSYR